MRTRWGIAVGLAMAASGAARAQDTLAVVETDGPHFFVAMVAGLLLAVGFQFVLTTLSMAAGVTAVGPVEKWGGARHAEEPFAHRVGKAARKVTSAFGIWALLTASLALFFASWLAVELSLTGSQVAGAVLGLVIWALFQVVMVSFEAAAFGSLAGTLTSAITGSLRSAWRATTSMFTPSPQAQAVDTATQVARAVREELTAGIEVDRLRDDLSRYVRQLAPQPIDAAALRRQIVELLDSVELRAVVDLSDLDREELVARFQARRGWDAHRAGQAADAVQGAVSAVREEARSGKRPVEVAADAALRVVGGMSSREAAAWRAKVEAWLRDSHRDELDPDSLKTDLERLWYQPELGAEALRARLSQIDRNTVAAVLASRGDLDQEQALRVVEAIDAFFRGAAVRLGAAADSGKRAGMGLAEVGSDQVRMARDRALDRIQDFLDGLGRPELAYEGIRRDMMRLFEDPRSGAQALVARLRAMDRETVRALATSIPGITPDRVDNFVALVLKARDEVVAAAERARDEVERRLAAARDEALRDAEEARRTAATAAWWGFGTAVISGGAAAAGYPLAEPHLNGAALARDVGERRARCHSRRQPSAGPASSPPSSSPT